MEISTHLALPRIIFKEGEVHSQQYAYHAKHADPWLSEKLSMDGRK